MLASLSPLIIAYIFWRSAGAAHSAQFLSGIDCRAPPPPNESLDDSHHANERARLRDAA